MTGKSAGLASTPVSGILALEPGKIAWVHNPDGGDLVCCSGVLWVTMGDHQDRILTSGDSLKVHKYQRALVHALRAARFTLRPHAESAVQVAGRPGGGFEVADRGAPCVSLQPPGP